MKRIILLIFLIISELGYTQTNQKFSMGGFGGPLIQVGETKNSP